MMNKTMEKTMNERMFEENTKLVYSIINKYYKETCITYREQKEDLIQVGLLSLYQATFLYDESRNTKFSTFAQIKIKNDLYNFCTKDLKRYVDANVKSLDYNYATDESDEGDCLMDMIPSKEDYSTIEESAILNHIKEMNNKKLYTIALMLLDGYTYEMIGKQLGITKQGVGLSVKKIRKEIEKEFGITSQAKVDGRLVAYNEEGFKMFFKDSGEASRVLGVNKSTIRRVLYNNLIKSNNTCKNMNNIKVHFAWA